MLATLPSSTDPVAGCQADAVPLPITCAVLGDGEYFLYSDKFNDTFKAEPARMAAEMAGLTEPKKWPADPSTRFFLWVADDGTARGGSTMQPTRDGLISGTQTGPSERTSSASDVSRTDASPSSTRASS